MTRVLPLLALGLCGCLRPRAQEVPPAPQEEVEAAEHGRAVPERAHAYVSDKVSRTAAWLDSFFASERHESEVNRTRLRVRSDLELEEAGEREGDMRVQLRLSLPGTEERLQLLVSSDAEDDLGLEEDPLETAPPQLLEDENGEGELGAEYFLLDDLRSNAKLEAGLRRRDGERAVRLGARYRRTVPLDSWLLRFTERLAWLDGAGYESRTTVDLDRLLEPDTLFRATTGVTWLEEESGVLVRQSFNVARRLSERNAVVYSWLNDFETEPHGALDLLRLRVGFRRDLWERRAFLELAPEARWDRDHDYDSEVALLLRLDLDFGLFEDGREDG